MPSVEVSVIVIGDLYSENLLTYKSVRHLANMPITGNWLFIDDYKLAVTAAGERLSKTGHGTLYAQTTIEAIPHELMLEYGFELVSGQNDEPACKTETEVV